MYADCRDPDREGLKLQSKEGHLRRYNDAKMSTRAMRSVGPLMFLWVDEKGSHSCSLDCFVVSASQMKWRGTEAEHAGP